MGIKTTKGQVIGATRPPEELDVIMTVIDQGDVGTTIRGRVFSRRPLEPQFETLLYRKGFSERRTYNGVAVLTGRNGDYVRQLELTNVKCRRAAQLPLPAGVDPPPASDDPHRNLGQMRVGWDWAREYPLCTAILDPEDPADECGRHAFFLVHCERVDTRGTRHQPLPRYDDAFAAVCAEHTYQGLPDLSHCCISCKLIAYDIDLHPRDTTGKKAHVGTEQDKAEAEKLLAEADALAASEIEKALTEEDALAAALLADGLAAPSEKSITHDPYRGPRDWVVKRATPNMQHQLTGRWVCDDWGPLTDGCLKILAQHEGKLYIYIASRWYVINPRVFDRFPDGATFHNARIVANEVRTCELGLEPLEGPCPCCTASERPVRDDPPPFASRHADLADRYGVFF